jgi:hypothetical protein
MLRYPDTLPSAEDMELRGNLFLVRHHFAKRLDNGLPEPDYNDGLAELDLSLMRLFGEDDGMLMLVETFGGKRLYYYYLRDNVEGAQALEAIKKRRPDEQLSCDWYDDPDWTFIKRFDASFSLWSTTH